MCSIGTCFLVGHKLWKQHFEKAAAVQNELTLSQVAKKTVPEYERLACFDGPPADAFDALLDKMTAAERKYMPLPQLLENSVELCNDSTLFKEGATVEDAFAILFGARSSCCKRFHDIRCDKEVRFHPPHPLVAEGAPWGATDTLTCKVPVPILGFCKYEEAKRFVLCREQHQVTLAVQQVGKLRAGLYGDFPLELLYLFTQSKNNEAVRMQVFTIAPKGRFAGAILEGYSKSIQDYCRAIKEAMQDWRNRSTSVKQEGPSKDDCHVSNGMGDEIMFSLLDYQLF